VAVSDKATGQQNLNPFVKSDALTPISSSKPIASSADTLAFQGISCALACQQSPSMASPVYTMIVMPIATVSHALIAAGRVQGRLQNF